MKFSVGHYAMMVAAFGALTALPARAETDDRAEIRALLARVKALEAKVAKQDKEGKATKAEAAHAANVANAAQLAAGAVKGPLAAPGVPPVVVTFTNGLKVETLDKDWSFKIGGRIFVDGGASSQPFNGQSTNVGIRRARLEVEGRAAKVWFYKLQYDFAGNAPYTSSFAPIGIAGCGATSITTTQVNNGAPYAIASCGGGNVVNLPKNSMIGGMRDLYFGTDSPLLTTPLSKDPAWIMIGNHYEPNSLDAITSSKYTDFVERALPADTFAAYRHIGLSVGLRGDIWTWKGGIYSTSPEDKALAPPASTGAPAIWVPGTSTSTGPLAITRNYAGTGGSQYFDLSSRFTVAPILDKEEGKLLHFGSWFRYHQPNDSTAANDDRNMTPGGSSNWNGSASTEANILNEKLLGTTDLSCGFVPQNYAQTISRGVFGGPLVSGKCVKDEEVFGFETAGAWGPFSVQGEYMHSHYNRSTNQLLYAATAAALVTAPSGGAPANGVYVPGGSNVDFTGYYLYTTYYLTGESRAEAYNVKDRNGAAFEQIKILHPFSQGGIGAWEIAARLSSVNLNSGPISGQSYVSAFQAATLAASVPGQAPAVTANYNNLARAIANAGIVGGRQNDFTLGVNWYPDKGVRFMANWVRVVNLSAPFDRPWEQGAHPNLFVMRAQVDW